VLVSVRRVVVHLPASFPFLPTFRTVALHWERRPDNTGFDVAETFFTPYRNYVRGRTLSANRCRANFYTPTTSPTPSYNQNHPTPLCSA